MPEMLSGVLLRATRSSLTAEAASPCSQGHWKQACITEAFQHLNFSPINSEPVTFYISMYTLTYTLIKWASDTSIRVRDPPPPRVCAISWLFGIYQRVCDHWLYCTPYVLSCGVIIRLFDLPPPPITHDRVSTQVCFMLWCDQMIV